MSVKTLNTTQPFTASSVHSQALTYSVEPIAGSLPIEPRTATPEVESFLEAENPLGCFRGVMWVMAFNAAMFLIGLTIWQSCKHLW